MWRHVPVPQRVRVADLLPVDPLEVLTWSTRPSVRSPARSSPAYSSPAYSSPSFGWLSDDAIEPVSSRAGPLFRIGCIADGSCFFHALLKGISPTYQETPSRRVALATGLRKDLAAALGMIVDPKTRTTLYDSLPVAAFADDEVDGLDYSLKGMQTLLSNPGAYVGDEVYALVSRALSISLIVVEVRNGHLVPNQIPTITHPGDPFVIIAGQRNHFELIGAGWESGLATVFNASDPLVASLNWSDKTHKE